MAITRSYSLSIVGSAASRTSNRARSPTPAPPPPAGHSDGRLIEVEAVDLGVREGLGDRDGGEALTAADLGHPHRRTRIELGLHLGECRQRVRCQVVDEHRARARRLKVAQVEQPDAAPVRA